MKISLYGLFIIFFFTSQPNSAISKPRYEPIDNIALDCGSPDNQTAKDNRRWVGDNDKNDGFSLIEEEKKGNSSSSVRALSQASSVQDVPYMTARISRSKFTYSFRVSVTGPKFVRLHFYPAQYEQDFDVRDAFFAVQAGQFTLLNNFSASLFASFKGQLAFAKEFCINVKEDQRTINITFIPASSSSFAFVNGIEFVSMPESLYYGPNRDVSMSPSLIGQRGKSTYGKYPDSALETLYRLNVGGNAIPPMKDTGMYRDWSQDRPLYFIGWAVAPSNTTMQLNYEKIENYTAPDDVYKTTLSMGPDPAANRARNLTWRMPVDRRFFYLVRLHFCQIQEGMTSPSDMSFYVYIDNRTAEEYANIVSWTGGYGNGIPVYRDYVVNFQDEDNLFVAVHPNGDESYRDDAFLNGIEVFKMSNGNKSLAGPNPSGSISSQSTNGGPVGVKSGSIKRTVLIVAVGVSSAFIVLICVVAFVILRKKKTGKERSSMRSSKGSALLPEDRCRHFYLWEIKSATRDFDKDLLIGRGGFVNVYKGFIDGDESKPVAVKRQNPGSGQGPTEFSTEIDMLSELRHVHLVSLIGYCNEEGEMILVYDYVSNGTLHDHLYGPNHEPLPWKTRLQICAGAARGLHYLHACVKDTIIHRDVKTTNILLDENWVAKVSDFGLSKVDPTGGPVSTLVKGTFGYLDPEYIQREKLTDKSDVYSFGVVLFEVLCGRKPLDSKLDEEQRSLAHWARKCARDGSIHEIIDPFLMGKIAPACFKKFVEVAESCLRDTWSQRPSMGEVTEKLEFALELQEQADAEAVAEQEKNNSGAGGVFYYPVVSFHLPEDRDRRAGFDLFNLTTTGGSGSTTGGSFISLETESRSDMFSETINNSESKV